jgi:hypothetical protein
MELYHGYTVVFGHALEHCVLNQIAPSSSSSWRSSPTTTPTTHQMRQRVATCVALFYQFSAAGIRGIILKLKLKILIAEYKYVIAKGGVNGGGC